MRRPGILVIDDNEGVSRLLTVVLTQIGFDVYAASSDMDSTVVFREFLDVVDIALVDVCWDGTDGLRSIETLRKIRPAVRTVIMTSGLTTLSATNLVKTGAELVVLKPFTGVFSLAQVLRALV